ncbi:MAG TPA: sigma-54 dependent transcriptional regulator, partial [Candidatus Deferrimicrobium sp.]|nr:sigma-54 dependent transcriptional regulator [Candidatus Deferrimicrobium sp.]
VIAQVFAAKGDCGEAVEKVNAAVRILREVGDPYDLAISLVAQAEIMSSGNSEGSPVVRAALDEAWEIFHGLRLDYWMAETDFKAGVLACQHGQLDGRFKKLSRAERVFTAIEEPAKLRAVHKFLQTLSEQAVALSVSHENKFKVFGSLITPAEMSNFKTGAMEESLGILVRKTNGSRAVFCSGEGGDMHLACSTLLTPHQIKHFCSKFKALLGQEISRVKPTLILDSRRDPYINDLFSDAPNVITSLIVVPFKMGDGSVSYLYVDRLSPDNSLNPFNQDELNFAVGFSDVAAFKWTEIQKNQLLEDNRRLQAQLIDRMSFPNIVTQNADMQELLAQVRQVVNSNLTIALEGETGSGKDLLARAIHFNSNRRDKRFISVNCAALPETLLESELFGYKRGAFTGADRDKPGLFEEADGGTFFLDEIADMPQSIQAKLLRLLEGQEIVRLGDTIPRKVDVRIISATNKNLKTQMESGLFRQDLFYRLTPLTFRLSALRERREDIPLLVAHFLEGTGKSVSPEVMKLMVSYDWPGNVRELENEVKKLVLLASDKTVIGPGALSGRISSFAGCESCLGLAGADSGDHPSFTDRHSMYDYLATLEKHFIVKALQEKHGVKKHAAALLNIPESTLRLKMKQYGLESEQYEKR